MAKTLNTWTLSGLMVGPILGTGILFLPPLAYTKLGTQAVWAWALVLFLGAGFAAVFIRMALKIKSDSGLASLVAQEWGPAWGELASNYLSGAVVFGAVPVLLTAARLWPQGFSAGLDPLVWAGILLVATVALLLTGLTTVSRLTLVLSSATAASLFLGSLLGLWGAVPSLPSPSYTPDLGPTLLMLFWAIVGWEVVGTYSNQVKSPENTIPRAGIISLAAVTLVYLVVTLALQTLAPTASGPPTVVTVLVPLFGSWAPVIAGILGGGLCEVTLLMFLGAVTRMTAQRAHEGGVPRWLGQKTPGSTPRRATLVLGVTSSVILVLVALKFIDLESLVSVANLFFLGNALLGLAAAWKILPGVFWRAVTVVLAAALCLLLTQGLLWGWVLIAAVTAVTFAVDQRRRNP